VYARRVDPSALAFSLSSHRHSHISLLLRSRFTASKETINCAFVHATLLTDTAGFWKRASY
jgi:hypothetical protein